MSILLVLLSCERTTVEVVEVDSVEISPSSAPTVLVGSSIQLSATPRSARGEALERTLTWASSDNAIATVSATGTVSGVSGGNVTITASTDGRSGSTLVQIDNRVPSITSLSPPTVAVGAPTLALEVNGTGFVAGSVVRFSGAQRPTELVSSTRLRTTLTAADLSSAGAREITVFTPSPGGGTSGVATLLVEDRVASITLDPQGHQVRVDWNWNYSATARNSSGTVLPDVPLAWSSSNTSVATVNAEGRVSAVGAGVTVIRATSGSVAGQSTLTVTADPCASVTVWAPSTGINGNLREVDCDAPENASHFFGFSSTTPFSVTLTTETSAFQNSTFWWRAQGLNRTTGIGGRFKSDPNDDTPLVNLAILPAGSFAAQVRSHDGRLGAYSALFEFGGQNPEVTGCTAAFIVPPVDYQGTITSQDCDFTEAGRGHGDQFPIDLRAGEIITVVATSAAVDTYLHLRDLSGNLLASDDDGGGSTNARLTYSASQTDLLILEVTTFSSGETGAYRLTVSSNLPAGSPPSFPSWEPIGIPQALPAGRSTLPPLRGPVQGWTVGGG